MPYQAYPAGRVLERIQGAGAALSILVLDAYLVENVAEFQVRLAEGGKQVLGEQSVGLPGIVAGGGARRRGERDEAAFARGHGGQSLGPRSRGAERVVAANRVSSSVRLRRSSARTASSACRRRSCSPAASCALRWSASCRKRSCSACSNFSRSRTTAASRSLSACSRSAFHCPASAICCSNSFNSCSRRARSSAASLVCSSRLRNTNVPMTLDAVHGNCLWPDSSYTCSAVPPRRVDLSNPPSYCTQIVVSGDSLH